MELSIRDLLGQKEFWAFLFVLGWLLLNWPMLTLAEGFALMGVPAILLYITTVWLVIVLLLYLFDRRNSD
jgi:hypothetical protein